VAAVATVAIELQLGRQRRSAARKARQAWGRPSLGRTSGAVRAVVTLRIAMRPPTRS
jgi:hypothetical protein